MNSNPGFKTMGKGRGRGIKQSDNSVLTKAEVGNLLNNCFFTKCPSTKSTSVENLSSSEEMSVPIPPASVFVSHDFATTDKPKQLSRGRGRGKSLVIEPTNESTSTSIAKITRSLHSSCSSNTSDISTPGACSLSSHESAAFTSYNNQNYGISHQPLPQVKRDHNTQRVDITNNFLRYDTLPPYDVQRIQNLKSAKVKLLKVVDDSGLVNVIFQDEDSIGLCKHFEQKMEKFYNSPEGRVFHIPTSSLQIGEIVAAIIPSNSETLVYRRVKILSIINKTSMYDASAYVIDIDNLSEVHIKITFALRRKFHQYPLQAYMLKITNFHNLHPRGIFEVFFDSSQTFNNAMSTCTTKVLKGLLLQSVFMSNLSARGGIMVGDLDPNLNWRFHSYYLNTFCRMYTPIFPKENYFTQGRITSISTDGKIAISLFSSLAESMYRIINDYELKHDYAEISESARQKMLKMIHSGECSMFLARYGKEKKYHRIRIQNFYEDKIKGIFIDVGTEMKITSGDLVCALTNNPNLPSILAEIPSQVIIMQLARVNTVSPDKCKELVGMHVKFKIVWLPTKLPEGEVYPITSSQSINELFTTNM